MIAESRTKDNKKIKVNAIDYELYTDKDINFDDDGEFNMCLISDFHDMSPKRMLNVAKSIKMQKPDMIIISGDILHSSKYKIDSKSQKNLKEFLKIIMKVCPVYLGLGNHDLLCMKEKYMNGYLDLASVGQNVHPLNNNVFYDK